MKYLILSLIFSVSSFASLKNLHNGLKYKTDFGYCPSRSAGELTLILTREFEKNHSLKDVKAKINSEKLVEKYYLSKYRLNYDPIKKSLKVILDCAEPVMRAQIYKNFGAENYQAVLGNDGKFYDAQYEELLRKEGVLTGVLPILAIPFEEIEGDVQKRISKIMNNFDQDLKRHLSELILSSKREITMVFSYNGKPLSIFLGKEDWETKVIKAEKILGYMESKNKFPSVVNLTNLKKVVVKF
jgi:hypothetical protein